MDLKSKKLYSFLLAVCIILTASVFYMDAALLLSIICIVIMVIMSGIFTGNRKFIKNSVLIFILSLIFLSSSCGRSSVIEQTTLKNLQTETSTTNNLPGQYETTAELPSSATTGKLEVHFIDVGQGDSILLSTDNNKILIDGGNRDNIVLSYLQERNISNLDLVISTHPHADHIGGLINVLQSVDVAEVMDPGVIHTTKTFEDYLTLIDNKNIKFTQVRTGYDRTLQDGLFMQVLHPQDPSESDLNDASIVVRFEYGDFSVLLQGDAGSEAESQILAAGYDLSSIVLKVGHHGSRTSSTLEYIYEVYPEVSIIMCAEGNSYGHPHQETLDMLSFSTIYRTDLHGSIIITSDGISYDISTSKPNKSTQITITDTTSSSSTDKININIADFDRLQDITGVGPAIANSIIDYREKTGGFKKIEDIMKVAVFAENIFEAMKHQITTGE